jgi:5-bromo-4-chloroindolyl phosphate hydrolysis protein
MVKVHKVVPKPEPKFLRTEIEITKDLFNMVHIRARDYYDTGNRSRHLGQFIYKNMDELAVILDKLSEMRKSDMKAEEDDEIDKETRISLDSDWAKGTP